MTAVKSFRLPDLGEGLTDAEIVAWHVAAGDSVALNQVLAEVETAKAVVELPSPFAGTVVELLATPGETVAVGAPIVTIETVTAETMTTETTDGRSDGQDEGNASPPDRIPTLVGYGPTESMPSRRRSRRRRSTRLEHPRAETDGGDGAPQEDTGPPAARGGVPARSPGATRPLAAPPVRFMARQEGVDLADVAGNGPGGIITRDDLAAFLRGRAEPWLPATAGRAEANDTAWTVVGGQTRQDASPGPTRTPVRGIQKRMAEAMVRSVTEAPQACVFLSVDVSETTALVERLRANREFAGIRVTLLSIVAKAVLRAMAEHPELNSSWDGGRGDVVFAPHVNLGIAVAAPAGLVVPNLPTAYVLGLRDLARALSDLSERAREGRCAPAEFRGGTFTISNVGVFGVDGGVAILNPGEAGILAVGTVRRTPWEHGGEVALRDVVTLSLTFDHRLVDGRQASGFLAAVGRVLADPLELLAFA
jgi:2-oxoisovalerate dehydrogenase E2 component (dihydrolipoyl transacylase)